ncbi:Signal transduction histidine kinase [Lutimaribacter pacificus]|uniref:histidine kinase n=1 Tax=Lutimaribacter pacificus TaxID=391948 RepID=A0A1H0HPW0_9RHOB|nr:HAMP domain-containing sensor histidine kinase [Lutimaribacter pacificus]SDO21206.1 Signal transduction histidine kinase [Lutimaribacter pacificus]SHK32818.1 Signal transduction histidine kinase [Lutimaribacter pacificus]
MTGIDTAGPAQTRDPDGKRVRQLRDYVNTSLSLIWQRQAIFAGALLLTLVYFDARWAIWCYLALQASELWDFVNCRQVARWNGRGAAAYRRFLSVVLASTVLSSVSISTWGALVAMQQGTGGHFMPLLFLFAASLFAAMNNHQFLPALQLRLVIYGVTFLFIAVLDIIRYTPPLTSFVWLEFFTVVFVMFFILDSSRMFLRLYRSNLHQMDVLRQEHERTRAAFRAKSQFVATVSHELRTPLTSISVAVDMVNSGEYGKLPPESRDILQIAAKNCSRLNTLVNDLLDLQKIEANEMAFHFDVLEVNDFIREAVEMHQEYGAETGNRVEMQGHGDEIWIKGDPMRLMQVMGNLLSNAIKFSHPGMPIHVSVARIDDTVRISVRDQGIGIPEGSRKLVFGRFSQIDASDRRQIEGTGLGMSIAESIVEHHDGIIDYVSELGAGTEFFVELPILKAPPHAAAAE